MRVSLRWLEEYARLVLPPEALAQRLTVSSAEVESVERLGGWGPEVQVARVLRVEPHPNADRLRLVTVDLGGEDRPRVVCGAPNVAEGQKVVFGRVGARIVDGHTGKPAVLKSTSIRGVVSAGMVLSERELGISDEHEGIVVLPQDAPVGAPLDEYAGDVIFEVYVAPNRPDMASVLGVARELAALTGQPLREPPSAIVPSGAARTGRVTVRIADTDLCFRYVGVLVEGVRVGPSPDWMQRRLQSAGMRPINNVVDITNYVMLELGQPLHAFDRRQLRSGSVVIRRSRAGEAIRTLDGTDRVLANGTLLICDGDRPVAVAGVMGGEDTEVSPDTTDVFLESATFAPSSVRRTGAALRLRTEASRRFERGLPPELAMAGARRAAHLLVELAGGVVREPVEDACPQPRAPVRLGVSLARVERVLGIPVGRDESAEVLERLGFTVEAADEGVLRLTVPYWRPDVRIEDDVAEEIVRMVGYDRLPSQTLAGRVPAPDEDPVRDLRERLRLRFAAAGLREVMTYSLQSTDGWTAAGDTGDLTPLRVANPVSSEHEYLRLSLAPGLLRTLAPVLRLRRARVGLFECGRRYLPRRDELPDERETVCGVLAGERPDRWGSPSGESLDFSDARGVVEQVLSGLVDGLDLEAAELPGLLPGQAARIRAGADVIGRIGRVDPRVAGKFDIAVPVYLVEVDVADALAARAGPGAYRPLSRFPAVRQDVALVVARDLAAGELRRAILETPLVVSARVFDVYEGAPLPHGKKSVAFALELQAPDRTLSEDEAQRALRRMIERLRRQFGAELRGG